MTDTYDADLDPEVDDYDGDQLDLAERLSLRRVAGMSTQLSDITEVEYRELQLERVVLVGVWTDGTADQAERSLRELDAVAELARVAGFNEPQVTAMPANNLSVVFRRL